ncbi:unnamed protein product [marine sediment metagenome]|uniref:Uncharacterized protein n=1 Tax=marine sediment metagenome TaxID=412755 RepID=X1SIT7_9ZZZZ
MKVNLAEVNKLLHLAKKMNSDPGVSSQLKGQTRKLALAGARKYINGK